MSNRGWQFNANNLNLLDDVYMLRTDHPEVGNWVRFPLRMETGEIRNLSPSYDNLCVHYGLYQKVFIRIETDRRSGSPLDREEVYSLKWQRKHEVFVRGWAKPIRDFLKDSESEFQFWFYCVPNEPDMFQMDEETGQIRWHWDPRMQVLSALPKTAAVASSRYSLDELVIRRLAPQVAWLSISFCHWGINKTRSEAHQMLSDYWDFLTREQSLLFTEKTRLALPH